MPAAGSKGAPRNPRELKDDTSASREEKLVSCKFRFQLVVYRFNMRVFLRKKTKGKKLLTVVFSLNVVLIQ